MSIQILHGDNRQVMAGMPTESIDAIVTDPPYELGFMGKKWDASGIAYQVDLWRECLRVLKPGGHLLAFGGTRTYHRMAVAIEDAGFEIRDSIHWVYGSGFPKSLNIGKAIDKRGGAVAEFEDFRDAVKAAMSANGVSRSALQEALGNFMLSHYLTAGSQPAVPNWRDYQIIRDTVGLGDKYDDLFRPEAEREVIGRSDDLYGRKSGIANGSKGHTTVGGTVAEAYDVTTAATDEARRWEGWGTALKPAHEPIVMARKPLDGTVAANVLQHDTGGLNIDGCRVGGDEGRWPANVVFDQTAGEALDAKSGIIKGQVGMKKTHGGHRFIAGDLESVQKFDYGTTDTGGASRFFTQANYGPEDWPFIYQAKPSKKERNAGLDGTNAHPTVKPVALMRHLIRLVTPPNGTVLDPFAGSGTTLVAAIHENKNAIGIELQDEYLPIIEGRIKHAEENREPEQATLGFDQ